MGSRESNNNPPPTSFGPTARRDRPPLSDSPHPQKLFYIAAVLFSALAGWGLIKFPPLFIIGIVVAGIFVVTVLVRPFWGLLIYTLLFLIRPAEMYPVLAPLHLERIVGILALAGMYFAQLRINHRLLIDWSKQTKLLLLFLVAVIITIPLAYWRGAAMGAFNEIVKIVVFYLLVVHLVNNRTRLRVFIWLFCLLTFYIGVNAFIAYLQGSGVFAQGIDRAVGGTSVADNPNSLATTLAVAVPLFILLALYRPLKWGRLFFIGGLPLLISTIAVTGSRGGLLGFLASMGYLWWVSKQRILIGLIGAILLVGGYQVLPEQYKARYSTIGQTELDASSEGRINAWKAGMRMLIDRPLIGVGVGCFSTAHAMGYSEGPKRSWLNAHSLYVQVPAELGLIGAFLFFYFLYEFLRQNRRTAKLLSGEGDDWAFERIVLTAMFAGCCVMLITAIFGHSMLRRHWYLFAGLGIAILRIYLDSPAGLTHRPNRS